METYKKVDYELNGKVGFILVNENVSDEETIKEMCFEDYLEKLKKEIKIIRRDEI